MACYVQNWSIIIALVFSVFSITHTDLPTNDVNEALRSLCTTIEYQNGRCPYFIGYDIITQLVKQWKEGDGGTGLWSDGSPTLWWPSGVGLWSLSEFLHTINSRVTDKLYFAMQWAAIETAKNQNNYVHTKFTDDQAWWANGALRLQEYLALLGDSSEALLNAVQAVINDNIAHETKECGGGVFWYYGHAPPSTTAKTTISNVLTIYLMATMYQFTHDIKLLQDDEHGGAIDIYHWLLDTDLLNRQTGYQRDTLETANHQCQLYGGSLTYEYGVLVQSLIALADATGNTTYIGDAMVYIQNAVNQFTFNNTIYEGCDETNTCRGDQLAFRGIFYLGLARLFERTKDQHIGEIIETSYRAMLDHKVGDRYPLSLINNNNNFTGNDLIVITIGDLNLVSAMIRVYEYKYNATTRSNIDYVINGLLPFDMTLSGLTGCVCQDIGCPNTHLMQCFNDSGHKDATGGHHWNEKVNAILVGPGHQMMLFKPNGTGHSDWLETSQWYVGNEYKDQVDSINIDYLF